MRTEQVGAPTAEVSYEHPNQEEGIGLSLAAPSGLNATLSTDSTIQLEWLTPLSDSPLDSFEIYMNDSLQATVAGDQNLFAVTSLIPDTIYSFKIRAKGSDGSYSPFSEEITAATSLNTHSNLSERELELKVEAFSDTTVNLSWSSSEPSPTVTASVYEIYVNDILSDTVTGTKTFHTVTNLDPGATYALKMKIIYQDGTITESNTLQVTTLSGVQVSEINNLIGDSGKPMALIENPASSSGTYLKYNADNTSDWIEIPFSAEQGKYQVDLRIWKDADMGIAQVLIDGNPVHDNLDFYNQSLEAVNIPLGELELDNGLNHTLRIHVVDKNADSSGFALGLDVLYLTRIQSAPIPTVPSQFTSSIQSDTSINLEWSAAEPAGSTTAYELYMNDNMLVNLSGERTFYTVKGLLPGTAYTFKIRALNAEGAASEFSERISVTTLSGKRIFEFEEISVGSTHSGKTLNVIEESKASAGAGLIYESLAAGDFIEFPFTLDKGYYQMDLRIRQSPDYGRVAVSVDGVALSPSVDFFHDDARYTDISLGNLAIDKRTSHTIRFEVAGKNENSTGFGLTVDAIYFTQVLNDTYEPNDSTETATITAVSQLFESYISSAADVDYYKFTAPADDTYFFSLQSPQDNLFKLEFLQAGGTPMLIGQMVAGSDTDAAFYLPANTTVFLRVKSEHNDFSMNPYRLRVTASTAKQYIYDDANRLIRMEYEQGLYHYQIDFEYDRNGNLLTRKTTKTTIN